jgi:predicted enzyme related to lactoylglutathione lyase
VGGGVGTDPSTGQSSEWVWHHEGGPMVFEPFKADTTYFAADRQAMVNFRVRDLDGMLADLRASGIEVSRQEEMEGVGRFARIHDPEGNPIELWEPT